MSDKDTIYRQAVIDMLNKMAKGTFSLNYEYQYYLGALHDVANNIKQLLPAESEQKWIPCSETIDIPNHEVLCCDKNGEELIGWLSYVDDQWLCESNGEMMYNPIAWREKPEPYREEGEQDG